MPLSVGDKLGPYEILAPIGAGGMGEVWKARDPRLDRFVAIKVLPDHIARRDDLRQRFESEARAVAGLNHPHICVLHDIGSHNGAGFMVMEYMEGETLAARIERGPLPMDQALKFALQIADPLDRAHRAGVTHRDVKPSNIMLTRDGVKLLDFGLAKSAPKTGPSGETLTAALTAEGSVLGTPQYMAPEQFEGKEADPRSDIWAFGAVFYEMVTGRKAFQGKNYTSMVGAILSADPPPMSLHPFTPPPLERLVRRCLAKDPDDRYQSMRDVVLDLQMPAQEPAAAPGRMARWPWAVAALAALGFLLLAFVHYREPPPPVLTLSILPPDNTAFHQIAISPDGRLLAFTAAEEGRRQIWVRPLHSLAAQPLAGTADAEYPFWSPDSRWIGFFAQGKLKKIEASGGPAQTLCNVQAFRGGAWNQDSLILYSDYLLGLFTVPAQGGAASQVTTVDRARGETRHRWPVFLPGGRRYLYLAAANDPNVTGIYLGSLDSKDRTRLVGDMSSAAHAVGPAGESHLLFARAGTLMAQPLDLSRSAVSGDAFPVAEKVGFDEVTARASFTVSGNGMLVYDASSRGNQAQLVWMDRAGKNLGNVGEPGIMRMASLSPDEKRAAVAVYDEQTQSYGIWLQDLVRGISTRFTFDPGTASYPLWSPDGSRILFGSSRVGGYGLHLKSASGAGREELLLKSANVLFPTDWSPDGRSLLYVENDPKMRMDLWVLSLEGDRKPAAFLRTKFNERGGAFSPDGRWIAYSSDDAGREEIYVQTYPASGAKWQVSKGGGRWPRWRPDGKELYFLALDGKLMAVEVSAGTTFFAGIAAPLFQTGMTTLLERYSVSRDGKRFLVPARLSAAAGSTSATAVWNWLAGVRR